MNGNFLVYHSTKNATIFACSEVVIIIIIGLGWSHDLMVSGLVRFLQRGRGSCFNSLTLVSPDASGSLHKIVVKTKITKLELINI